MKTCIMLHQHEIVHCPGPMTLLRPIHSSCLEIPSCCPYGQPGDVLAVRETWRRFSARDECSHYDDCDCARHDGEVLFYDGSDMDSRWRSPQTMPAALARWQFTVEGVEVKRAFAFSDDELVQSGLYNPNRHYPCVPGPVNPLLWVMRGNVEARR
jgi:hypothetical protein